MEESIGKRLTAIRLNKGMTIDEVSDLTRINHKMIRAVEDDDFGKLPGKVFTVGFLRAYARVLAIDEDDLVERFSRLNLEDVDNSPKFISESIQLDPTRDSYTTLALSVVVAIILIALYFFEFNVEIRNSGKPAEESAAAVKAAPHKAQVKSSEKRKERPEKKSSEPETKLLEAKAQKIESPRQTAPVEGERSPADMANMRYTLTIEADSDSWIKADIDGEIKKEIIIRQGNQVTWQAANGFVISIGNVAGTRITLNGEEIILQKPASNIITGLTLPAGMIPANQTESINETQRESGREEQ